MGHGGAKIIVYFSALGPAVEQMDIRVHHELASKTAYLSVCVTDVAARCP